jgi:hypothetical protein
MVNAAQAKLIHVRIYSGTYIATWGTGKDRCKASATAGAAQAAAACAIKVLTRIRFFMCYLCTKHAWAIREVCHDVGDGIAAYKIFPAPAPEEQS